LCLLFVLSRALSAFAAVTFPKAKKDGMLRQETDQASGITAAAMGIITLFTCVVLIVLNMTGSAGKAGSGSTAFPLPAACAIAAGLGTLLFYRHMAVKHFGGTTGDLSGWFTQTCELVTAAAVIAAFRIM
jgi:adenosylcobinamide-GDP ribazoletransferase